jgi:hypothetical protein
MVIRLAVLLLIAGAASAAYAQKPPPPNAVIDPSRPRLVQGRLDYRFCNYPVEGVRRQLEGCCRMKVDVGANGVAGAATGQCSHDMFLKPSQLCLSGQSYVPANRNGKSVAGVGDIVVYYRLPYDPPDPVTNFFQKLFPQAKSANQPDPDYCEKRPGDLISSLDRTRGG